MKKALVFLTPATKDKAGEVIELQYESEPVKYLEPVSPYASNDEAAELSKLKARVVETETALRHALSKNAPALEIQRLEGTLAGLKAELDQAEMPRRKQRQRETGIGRDDAPPPARQTLAELVASTVAAVKAVVATPTRKARNSWDTWAADFDQRLAVKRALEVKNTSHVLVVGNTPVCCEGKRLCPKCAAA
jgi:hypothetical protein